jgi:hypothetical protein
MNQNQMIIRNKVNTMTNIPIDRKAFQRVKTETEQNDRVLGRTIITTVATSATVIGWMLFANTTPVPPTNAAPVAQSEPLAAVEVRLDYAPIPTVYALPNLAPLPPLAQQQQPVAAPITVSNVVVPVAPVAPVSAVAPAPVAQPVVRVVARPAAPVVPVAQTGGSK